MNFKSTELKNLSVVILGPGAIGGFLTTVFLKKGFTVEVIAKHESIEIIEKNGIRLQSKMFGNFITYPKVSEILNIKPNFIFITTKAYSLKSAIEKIDLKQITEQTFIIPLLNGIDHLNILKKKFGKKVIAASISIEVSRQNPQVILHTSNFAKMEIASDEASNKNQIENISSILTSVGIEVEIGLSEAAVLWNKLIRLNALACATTLTNKPIGVLRRDLFWRQQIIQCIREASNVAKMDNVHINTESVMKKIDSLEYQQMSSMQRDIINGKNSEIDYIAGAIIKRAKKYHIQCPTIKKFFSKIITLAKMQQNK